MVSACPEHALAAARAARQLTARVGRGTAGCNRAEPRQPRSRDDLRDLAPGVRREREGADEKSLRRDSSLSEYGLGAHAVDLMQQLVSALSVTSVRPSNVACQ